MEVQKFINGEHRYLHVAFYKTGTQDLVHPDLDRILSKAIEGAEALVQVWIDNDWYTNNEGMGPVAEKLVSLFEMEETKQNWADLTPEQIAVEKFSTMLTMVTNVESVGGTNDENQWGYDVGRMPGRA